MEMTSSRDRMLFWCSLAAGALGYAVFVWKATPIYRRLLSHGAGADVKDFAIFFSAVFVMQLIYWLVRPLHERMQFRRNVVLGTILMWISELLFFFPHALAVVIVFDSGEEREFVLWKLLILVGTLFALFCFKHQVETLGEAMIEAEE